LDTIVIGKNLAFDNAYRASVPDNHRRILFIGIEYDYSDDYIRYTFHREMNHYIEFNIWNSYYYDWEQWRVLYTGGNADSELAYQGRDANTWWQYRPTLPGFLNTYSMLGQEEDRSEMMAFYLTDNINIFFIRKARNDELFYQKAVTLFTFYKEELNFNLLDEFLRKMNQ
jgi:hypothetical protein